METLSLASLSLATILAGLPSAGEYEAVSQSVIRTHISPAIAGSWVLQLPSKSTQSPLPDVASIEEMTPSASTSRVSDCKEYYTFAEDNKMWTVSGEEWTYGRYVVSHQDEGLPIIAMNTLHDNNKVDCSGNQVDQTGNIMFAFVDYESDDSYMHWCNDKDGTQCFMTLKRQLP
ncbi:hypothetical protein [Psychrobacter sp. I-STPA6b]|uniref:hypothetical protein n=1 Tax=Psychrobacter sp. I-STPA6b TaxID=2585718 RepID=UPI001D0CD12F|nr:hypothetical protein [Psychrobacter sp. I-STPA6b]